MRRRALLASIPAGATLLTGCQSPSSDEEPFRVEYTTVTDRELSIDPAPVAAAGVDWTVEKRAPATDREPCRVRVTVTNVADDAVLTADGALPYPTARAIPVDHDPGAIRPVLLPVEADYDRRFNGNCWLAPLQDPDVADDAPWEWQGTRSHELAPGDRAETTYHLVSSYPSTCFPRGEYRFRRRYELGGADHEWSFSLSVPSVDRDG